MSTYGVSVSESGLSDLLRRMSRECPNNQWVRELVKNSIEACEDYKKQSKDKKYKAKVLVDFDKNYYELQNQHKVCFIDNGIGMSSTELVECISQLSKSGQYKKGNPHENYGIGAKISSITRNEVGMWYKTWKDGEGVQAYLHYDKDTDVYGLKEFIDEDGNVSYTASVDDSMKPDLINDHGTIVTLLGNEINEDTMDNSTYDIVGTKESWLLKYLNKRFHSFPEDIEIKCRVGYYRDIENTRHNYLKVVNGYKETISKHVIQEGKVDLSDAIVHWALLKKGRQSKGRDFVAGHTGVLHQNELFDIHLGTGNKALGFGLLGGKDLYLHIEPTSPKYVQNNSRSGIIKIGEESLPWERWQSEFRDQIPKELQDYMQGLLSDDVGKNKSIKDRLKKYKQFYKLSKYKLNKRGQIVVDSNDLVESETGGFISGGTGRRSSSKGSNSGIIEDLLAITRKNDGQKATEVNDPFPDVQWVAEENDICELEEIKDRAGVFREDAYRIFANEDFTKFQDAENYFAEKYKDEVPRENIKGLVQEVFQQQLMETIAGVMSLKNRKDWSGKPFESAISPEALTVAVSSTYYFYEMINRQLGGIAKQLKLKEIIDDEASA